MSNPSYSQQNSDPGEVSEEVLLRAILREHAPLAVDLEQGWTNVSRRLFSAQTMPVQRASCAPGAPRWMRWQFLVAAAALLILLLGASLAGPLSGTFGGKQRAYAATYSRVSLSHLVQSQGITVKSVGAFANLDRTCVAAYVELSPGLANHSFMSTASTLTYQRETLSKTLSTSGSVTQPGSDSKNFFIECFSAAHPTADASKITLKWKVSQLTFTNKQGQTQMVNTNWELDFTTPFYQNHNKDFKPMNLEGMQ